MKKKIAIIGGGASALLLAAHLDEQKFEVTIYERNSALGRKFLVAGEGGLNLTHSENFEDFISRYVPTKFLERSLRYFSPLDLRKWFLSIGIETYVGSTKRVFPIKGIKPIDVFNAILQVLKQRKVTLLTSHTWQGFLDNGQLLMNYKGQQKKVLADFYVFALGGASWKVTGSNSNWLPYFEKKGIEIIPFQPSNCAVRINWPQEFIQYAEGKVLKNISISSEHHKRKGEVVITQFGIEGGAIYALIGDVRKQLYKRNTAQVFVDFKPSISVEEIQNRIKTRGKNSLTKHLQSELNLTKVQILLLKTVLNKTEFISSELLAVKIKNLPLTIQSLTPIDQAISTVGGIALNQLDSYFQLNRMPKYFCIGEMLDWDAPTGGYLLQACFSMGAYLASYFNLSSYEYPSF